MGRHDSHFDASTSLSMDWMVAQIRPGQTDRAITNLRRQSFDVFCPMERRPTGGSIPKRSKPVSPLFPGYVFVKSRIDASPWQKINSTYGVSRLLMSPDGTPSNVRSDIMNGIIMSTDEDGVLLPPDTLDAGTSVRIMSGAFANWIGEVEAMRPDERYILLINMMGRQVRTDVSRTEVQRAL